MFELEIIFFMMSFGCLSYAYYLKFYKKGDKNE